MDFTCCRCGLERNPSDGERITVVKLPCDTLMLTLNCVQKEDYWRFVCLCCECSPNAFSCYVLDEIE